MIVVDTNVIAYLLIAGEKTPLAQQAFERDSDWIVPPLWRHEFLNVLATFARQGGGTLDQVLEVWRRAVRLFAAREHEVNFEQALQISHESGISAYDAQYVTVSLALDLPLVTEDRQLLEAFPEAALSLAAFLQLPTNGSP